MANMKISPVKIDKDGGINMIHFKHLAEKFKDTLAALMVTYPSTNGFFDSEIRYFYTSIALHFSVTGVVTGRFAQ